MSVRISVSLSVSMPWLGRARDTAATRAAQRQVFGIDDTSRIGFFHTYALNYVTRKHIFLVFDSIFLQTFPA
jgi:transposase-like protein